MTPYSLLILVHTLLFVFWVGTDVGVFVLTRYAQRPRYSVEERLLCLHVATLIDRFPRICFVLILAVGAQLASLDGLLPLSSTGLAAVWAFDAAWLAVVLSRMAAEGRPIAPHLRDAERLILLGLIVGIGSYGLRALAGAGGAAAIPTWFGCKLLAYAVICLWALALDFLATPSIRAFAQLAAEGASDEVQHKLDRALPPIFLVVILIYLTATLAAYCGLAKLPA